MTTNLSVLTDLNSKALACLRTGSAPEEEWFKQGIDRVTKLEAPENYNDDEKTLIVTLKARQRFADLADRRGRRKEARHVIGEYHHWVLAQLEMEGPEVKNKERFQELLWYVVVHSLVEHRDGKITDALENVEKVQRYLSRSRGEYLDLRHRVALARGRHLQSLTTTEALRDAELHYTEALRYCELIARSARESANKARKTEQAAYARYRLGVTLTALARLFLERGELARALRECYAARILLDTAEPLPDKLTIAYIDYLIGSILRQQGNDLPAAINLLEEAKATFLKQEHPHYYARCRNELAKALLNRKEFEAALPVIRTNELPECHRKSSSVWQANDACLEGRILLELAQADGGHLAHVSQIKRLLKETFDILASHVADPRYRDILIRGLLLGGELSLALNNPAAVLGGVKLGTETFTLYDSLTQAGKIPLDRTDIGWGWLVLARVYLALNLVGHASSAVEHYRRLALENRLFEERAQRIDTEINEQQQMGKGLWFPCIPPTATSIEALEKLGLRNYPSQLANWTMGQLEQRTGDLRVTEKDQARLMGISPGTLADLKKGRLSKYKSSLPDGLLLACIPPAAIGFEALKKLRLHEYQRIFNDWMVEQLEAVPTISNFQRANLLGVSEETFAEMQRTSKLLKGRKKS
jgi:hypothetical protein